MLTRFVNYITQQHLFDFSQEVLLAISGGRDSVALCDLASRAGIRFAIAHCNFHLRPGDCDRDQQFVSAMAERYQVPLHVAQFHTQEESQRLHHSIEETAREERYHFFDQLCQAYGYACVATAHHQDDAIETFFINLLRGTGISGMHGIKVKSGRVVRPMLCFTRDEIDQYIADQGLTYVDDYTNDSLAYRRNQIRHQLVPLMCELSPSFPRTMVENMRRISEVEIIYQEAVKSVRSRILQSVEDAEGKTRWRIRKSDIDKLNPQRTLLYETLRPFHFSAVIVDELLRALHGEVGRQFYAADYRMVIERDFVEITSQQSPNDDEFELTIDQLLQQGSLSIGRQTLCVEEKSNNEVEVGAIRLSSDQLSVDVEKVGSIVRFRHWRVGDRFHPFGMKGTRLLSDYFKDSKITQADKQSVWLMCDANDQIVWVVGYRADDRYKVTEGTRQILLFCKR